MMTLGYDEDGDNGHGGVLAIAYKEDGRWHNI
jgi:hypothetical protein